MKKVGKAMSVRWNLAALAIATTVACAVGASATVEVVTADLLVRERNARTTAPTTARAFELKRRLVGPHFNVLVTPGGPVLTAPCLTALWTAQTMAYATTALASATTTSRGQTALCL